MTHRSTGLDNYSDDDEVRPLGRGGGEDARWPSDLAAEPAPADIRGVLDERNVPIHEWGELEIDGVVAPVVTVDGFLETCGPSGSCRESSANRRFYVLIPYVNGTLVVGGDLKNEVMAGDQPMAQEMDVVVDELQVWADSIQLP